MPLHTQPDYFRVCPLPLCRSPPHVHQATCRWVCATPLLRLETIVLYSVLTLLAIYTEFFFKRPAWGKERERGRGRGATKQWFLFASLLPAAAATTCQPHLPNLPLPRKTNPLLHLPHNPLQSVSSASSSYPAPGLPTLDTPPVSLAGVLPSRPSNHPSTSPPRGPTPPTTSSQTSSLRYT